MRLKKGLNDASSHKKKKQLIVQPKERGILCPNCAHPNHSTSVNLPRYLASLFIAAAMYFLSIMTAQSIGRDVGCSARAPAAIGTEGGLSPRTMLPLGNGECERANLGGDE